MNRYLQVGTHLKNSDGEYEIKDVVGTGASCAVYYAEFVDTSGVRTEHLLKEYNPRGLKLERDEKYSLHICSESDASVFEAGLLRFKAGYEMQLNVRRSSHTKNSTSNIQGVFDANGTRYIDMTVMAGTTYEKVEEETLYNLLKRIETITKVVSSYHENGLLHLDIKPDNIFVLSETVELVQIFDFDSVIKKNDVASSAFLSYTQSWAAQEQILPNRKNRICEATDIFAIGEILFYKIMGRHSEARERRSFATFTFDYSKKLFEGVNPRVFPLLSEIFKHTICNVVTNRYQSTSELLEKLKQAILLADPHEPFLQHHLPSKASYFVGRDVELHEIERRLSQSDKLFISGMGGMGKSELVRQYAHAHKEEYDAVIFSVCNTDLESMILDDSLLPICHVQRGDKKNRDYLKEKYSILKRLCNKRVLVIVDNFNDLQDNTLSKLMQLNCKILFTTRCDVSEYSYEQLSLGVLGREYVWDIFRTWYKVKLNSEDRMAVEQILDLYQDHTMAVELIAKQMRASCIIPKKMLDKLNAGGFSDSGRERVVHAKDSMNTKMNIHDHIRRLFDVSELSEEQVHILADLSLMPPSGIEKSQFHDWCKLETYEDINELVESGWIRLDEGNKQVSLHPVIAAVMHDDIKSGHIDCDDILASLVDAMQEPMFEQLNHIPREQLFACSLSVLDVLSRYDYLSENFLVYLYTVAMWFEHHRKPQQIITYIKKAIALSESDNSATYENTRWLYHALGGLHSDLYRDYGEDFYFQEAETYYQKAWEQTGGPSTAEDYGNLSVLYSHSGDYEKAISYSIEAIRILKSRDNYEQDITPATLYGNLGMLYNNLKKYDDALMACQKAQDVLLALNQENSTNMADLYRNFGIIYEDIGDVANAMKYYQLALEMYRTYYGGVHPETALVQYHIGILCREHGHYAEALQQLTEVREISAEVYGKIHPWTAKVYSALGKAYAESDKIDSAKLCYKQALSIRRRLFPEDDPSIQLVLERLEKLH